MTMMITYVKLHSIIKDTKSKAVYDLIQYYFIITIAKKAERSLNVHNRNAFYKFLPNCSKFIN